MDQVKLFLLVIHKMYDPSLIMIVNKHKYKLKLKLNKILAPIYIDFLFGLKQHDSVNMSLFSTITTARARFSEVRQSDEIIHFDMYWCTIGSI